MTHRTGDSASRDRSSSAQKRMSKAADQGFITLDNNSNNGNRFKGDPSMGGMMLFHKTNDHHNPGVGDYKIDDISLNLKR